MIEWSEEKEGGEEMEEKGRKGYVGNEIEQRLSSHLSSLHRTPSHSMPFQPIVSHLIEFYPNPFCTKRSTELEFDEM